MPNYDYECDACGHRFEEFQSMNDKHLTDCPKCGKPKLRRLIGAGAGIIFKGSGFYQTDYKKNGSAAPSSSNGSKSEASPAPAADKSCGSCGKTGPNVCD
jgi:putative FmdB family regulatory protein